MSGERSSRRLADLPPEEEQLSKRRSKSNTKSLKAFDESRPMDMRKSNSTKRPRKNTDAAEANKDPETSTLKAQRQKKAPTNVVDIVSSPLASQLPPSRKKLFDPTHSYDKPPHFVHFIIFPTINNKRKDAVPRSLDINSSEKKVTFKLLVEFAYKHGVKLWEETRSLTEEDEKPRRIPFLAIIGTEKKPVIRMPINGDSDLRELFTSLRHYKHSQRAIANEVILEAHWKTFDQAQSESENDTPTGKGKGKQKSKADKARSSVRRTPL